MYILTLRSLFVFVLFLITGSFKARGIGYLCSNAVHKRGCTHLISSSGGNAGYATAFVGKRLGVKVTVVVPESAPELIITKLRKEGAEVIVHGGMWSKAHEKATELASQEGCELIHPFEHEEIWQGHETLIEECNKQLTKKPAAVVCSVGGGGLIIGVLSGMHKVGWGDVPVIAVETEGADSFAQSVKASEVRYTIAVL
jgi:L-serine/L-threonine ammonia-lyase